MKRVLAICLVLAVCIVAPATSSQAAVPAAKPQISAVRNASALTVTGRNLPANTAVVITFSAPSQTYTANARTDASGSFGFRVMNTDATRQISKVRARIVNSSAAPSSPTTSASRIALVYRGPAACDGCPEAAAALLKKSKWNFTVKYVGPNDTPVTPAVLKTAALYVQPGGGDDLDEAWVSVASLAPAIREYVKSGGRYLGICMGGYLAGQGPGYDLLPGDAGQYVGMRGSTVQTTDDTLVQVKWRGKTRSMFFQDGNYVTLNSTANATVLATFANGAIAASVTPYGSGKVGVSGPHPEADASWYSSNGLKDPDGPDGDLGVDLINTVMQ